MINTNPKNIAIIGAGITGLSAAYHLQKAGHQVTLLEKSKKIGGAIQTSTKDGYLIEHGPNSLLISDTRVQNLIQQLGLEPELLTADPAAKKRFIIHNGKLNPLPLTPSQALTTPLFSLKAKLRLLKEPFIKKRDPKNGTECFADFVRRRCGQEFLEKAADPFVNGIYAGDPNRLATAHAFPKLWDLEQTYGSIIKGILAKRKATKDGTGDPNKIAPNITSFTDGMHTLPRALAAALTEGTCTTSATIHSIKHKPESNTWFIGWSSATGTTGQGNFDHLIITTPAHKLAKLPLEDTLIDALSKLPDISYPPVTSILFGFKKSQIKHPLDGFGMLSAATEHNKILGALFPSSLFPNRAPEDHACINVMLGGARNPELARLQEADLKAYVMDELRRFLGIEGQPTFMKIIRWEKAIPQFNLGYSKVLEQITQAERDFPGLTMAGNYVTGISVPDCILSGIDLTEKITSQI